MIIVPYTKDQRYCLNKQLRELNDMDFKFMAHVGDIKWGKTSCYKSSFSDVAEIFSHPSNALNYDTRDCFFVPGDNEWVDCQDPDQAWRWWMQCKFWSEDWICDGRNLWQNPALFCSWTDFGNGKSKRTGISRNGNGFGTLSDPNISVEYQRQSLTNSNYPSTAGNFAFFTADVLFIGINQVGGGTHGDESTRVHSNYEWVEYNMAEYQPQGMRAVVIFAHATMTSSRRWYFGNPFMSLLRREYPDVIALYIHGDGHNFEINQPDSDNPNLNQLEVDVSNCLVIDLLSLVFIYRLKLILTSFLSFVFRITGRRRSRSFTYFSHARYCERWVFIQCWCKRRVLL